MRHVLLLFVDGLGLGANDPASNPVVAAHTPFLDALLGRKMAGIDSRVERDGVILAPTDATLGVDGLPQSATGQTALLTGINAPQVLGRHITAYPTATLREILTEHNIFRKVRDLGGEAALANAYTPEYFSAVEEGRLRNGAITFSAMAAGVRLRTLDDLRAGQAVFHDLTNARPRAWGHDVPAIGPGDAGRNLARIAGQPHLTVFEFFLSDLVAHGRVPQEPVVIVEMLDGFLRGVVEAADLKQLLIIMTSDHGNLEDGEVTTHTRNPVPTILIGSGRHAVADRIHALTDITPAIVSWLAEELSRG